jgi:hypothetical protein
MTGASALDELEREVERARARLANDIARLRDPQTLSHARADLMAQAGVYRDRVIEKIGGAANERAQGFVDGLRQRALENPAAVVAIGAGVLWRLWKHPPIATLLLGAGVASLLAGRGDDGQSASDGLLGRVRDVNRATHALGDRASDLAERARDTVADMAKQARMIGDQASESLAHAADRTAIALADLNEGQGEALRENPVAMSVAAMALGAAVGVALRRRA